MDLITKMQSILYVMRTVEKDLTDLMKSYDDNRGNLDESSRMAGDIITNVEGHIRDITEGKE